MGRKLLYLTVAVILGLMLRTMLAEAKSDSATMDEGVHLTAGYSYIQTQDNRLNPEHPPLVKDLAGLAVSTESFNFPIKWFKSHVIGQYDLGFKFMYHSGNDPDRILYLARLPIVAITVVLGLFVFLWSRELNGTAAGLFSLVLFAFDPNFIAHGHYVTHDVPLSAAIVINLYLVWRYLKNPTRLRWLLSGVSLGLALLTKFSAPLLFPAYLVILVYLAVKDGGVRTVGAPAAAGLETAKSTSAAEAKGPAVGLADKTRSIPSAFQGRNISRTLRRFWRYSLPFIGMAGVAAVLIYIVYGLNMMAMPVDVQYSIMWRMLPAPAPFLSFLGQTGLRPLSYFLMGLDIVKNHVADGQLIYFMGRITPGHILYYPVAFLVKSTLPTLFLVGVAIIFGRRVKSKNPLAEVALLSTMIIFLITVLLGKLDLGIRYILPFYALFYVYAGKFIKLVRVESFGRWIGGRFRPARSMLNVAILSLVIVQIASCLKVAPYHTAFYNELVGIDRGGRMVADSNIDWGQDLKRLQAYVDKKGIKRIYVDYFGAGEPRYYLGDRAIYWWGENKARPKGWFAVSWNYYLKGIAKGNYRWLQKYKPVDRVGASILVFKLPET